MEKDIGEEIIEKLQDILRKTEERNKNQTTRAEMRKEYSKDQDVANQISQTLEEMITKLKFMIEETEYQIKAIKEKQW